MKSISGVDYNDDITDNKYNLIYNDNLIMMMITNNKTNLHVCKCRLLSLSPSNLYLVLSLVFVRLLRESHSKSAAAGRAARFSRYCEQIWAIVFRFLTWFKISPKSDTFLG